MNQIQCMKHPSVIDCDINFIHCSFACYRFLFNLEKAYTRTWVCSTYMLEFREPFKFFNL